MTHYLEHYGERIAFERMGLFNHCSNAKFRPKVLINQILHAFAAIPLKTQSKNPVSDRSG